jgi:cell division protein FtsQ
MAERIHKGKNGQASRPVSLLERLRPWWPRAGRAVLVAAVLLAGAGLVRWTQDPHTLPMRQLQIEGSLRYLSHAELQAQVGPYVQGGFFNVDVAAIQRAAQELDWVDRVSVRRVWPDTLRLHVQEQRAVARWGDGALLNQRGERFAAAGREVREPLPRLQGPAGREAALLAQYQELAGILSAAGLQVVRFGQDERRALELTLESGVRMQLGRGDATARVRRFLRAYPSLVASREENLHYVDLRYSNGFAVRWTARNGTTES